MFYYFIGTYIKTPSQGPWTGISSLVSGKVFQRDTCIYCYAPFSKGTCGSGTTIVLKGTEVKVLSAYHTNNVIGYYKTACIRIIISDDSMVNAWKIVLSKLIVFYLFTISIPKYRIFNMKL